MKEIIKENLNTPKSKILMLIGTVTFLSLIVGATYAFFGITANNNGSNTTISGRTDESSSAILNTNTSNLYLKLKAADMAESKQGSIYYANSEENGTPITNATLGSGIYTLATASLQQGAGKYNCTYNYELSATVGKVITDGSDENVKVIIKGDSIGGGSKTYTLKELLSGTQTLTGVFRNLSSENDQTITIESIVENTSSSQNGLAGNNYTITINPKSGSEGFSCEVAIPQAIAGELIDSGELWQSGLEGDGYRYTGSGNATASTTPNNFICFGTNSLSECKANEDKYMYRIIGVFPDEDGNNHLKLIKFKQLTETYSWHSDETVDVPWEESDLYKGLNGIKGGSYSNLFIGNTTYDYLQDETWSNKIADWKWTATNTLTIENSGPYYGTITTEQMYLHEMNRSTISTEKSRAVVTPTPTIKGKWTYPKAKIGLMYASDYQMSLGSSSLKMTSEKDEATLKTGWLHLSNNDTTADTNEWTISRAGANGKVFLAYLVNNHGSVLAKDVTGIKIEFLRPVFYLDSTVTTKDGTGSYSKPYLING